MNRKILLLFLLLPYVYSCATETPGAYSRESLARNPQFAEEQKSPESERRITENIMYYQRVSRQLRPGVKCFSTLECSEEIVKLVTRKWQVPYTLRGLDIKATYSVKIDKQGVASSVDLVSSSGNTNFDHLCATAIYRSLPFSIEYVPNQVEIEELSSIRIVFVAPPLW